jgi:hypothetical protein
LLLDIYLTYCPYHYIQVSEVTKAIDGYNSGDTSPIWKKNKETMRSLGAIKVKEITSKLLLDARKIVEDCPRPVSGSGGKSRISKRKII